MSTETGARMATNDVRDGELVTTEPPAVTVVTTPAEDAVTATLGALLVGGSLADAWAHTNILNELESFFTPWHALLYGGFTASAAWTYWLAYRRRRYRRHDLAHHLRHREGSGHRLQPQPHCDRHRRDTAADQPGPVLVGEPLRPEARRHRHSVAGARHRLRDDPARPHDGAALCRADPPIRLCGRLAQHGRGRVRAHQISRQHPRDRDTGTDGVPPPCHVRHRNRRRGSPFAVRDDPVRVSRPVERRRAGRDRGRRHRGSDRGTHRRRPWAGRAVAAADRGRAARHARVVGAPARLALREWRQVAGRDVGRKPGIYRLARCTRRWTSRRIAVQNGRPDNLTR